MVERSRLFWVAVDDSEAVIPISKGLGLDYWCCGCSVGFQAMFGVESRDSCAECDEYSHDVRIAIHAQQGSRQSEFASAMSMICSIDVGKSLATPLQNKPGIRTFHEM